MFVLLRSVALKEMNERCRGGNLNGWMSRGKEDTCLLHNGYFDKTLLVKWSAVT